ncbi:MAG: tetratricopeptide repeat protein [Halofilum sp. (in: g-proteobacteria)]|nr:tetratricopeptide repeat protein [Halofilum sp. (in: g-proteobacteria)]
MSRIDAFERMLEQGQDGALLRFSLGNEYLAADDPASAMRHLRRAVEHDPDYSAAWRALGKAAERCDDADAAAAAYESGIEAAQRRGDKQAAREMQVFLRRLLKARR